MEYNRLLEILLEIDRESDVIIKSYCCPHCGRVLKYEEKCDRCRT